MLQHYPQPILVWQNTLLPHLHIPKHIPISSSSTPSPLNFYVAQYVLHQMPIFPDTVPPHLHVPWPLTEPILMYPKIIPIPSPCASTPTHLIPICSNTSPPHHHVVQWCPHQSPYTTTHNPVPIWLNTVLTKYLLPRHHPTQSLCATHLTHPVWMCFNLSACGPTPSHPITHVPQHHPQPYSCTSNPYPSPCISQNNPHPISMCTNTILVWSACVSNPYTFHPHVPQPDPVIWSLQSRVYFVSNYICDRNC